MRILSYNIQAAIASNSYFSYLSRLHRQVMPSAAKTRVLSHIAQYISEFDIVCLQEAPKARIEHEVVTTLNPIYPYQSEMVHETSGDVLTLYSKYPIISTERIPFDSEVNLSVAYRIKVGKDTVLVVNNHLESNNMTNADKAGFKNIVQGNITKKETKQESSLLLNKLAIAAKKRAVQVEAVANVLKKYQHLPQIV